MDIFPVNTIFSRTKRRSGENFLIDAHLRDGTGRDVTLSRKLHTSNQSAIELNQET